MCVCVCVCVREREREREREKTKKKEAGVISPWGNMLQAVLYLIRACLWCRSCSIVLDCLHWLHDRGGNAHQNWGALVWSGQRTWNKQQFCSVFGETFGSNCTNRFGRLWSRVVSWVDLSQGWIASFDASMVKFVKIASFGNRDRWLMSLVNLYVLCTTSTRMNVK